MSSMKELLEKQNQESNFYGDGDLRVTDFFNEKQHLEFVNDLMLEMRTQLMDLFAQKAVKEYSTRIEKHENEMGDVSPAVLHHLCGLYKAKFRKHSLLGLVRFVRNNKDMSIEEINDAFIKEANFREFYEGFQK